MAYEVQADPYFAIGSSQIKTLVITIRPSIYQLEHALPGAYPSDTWTDTERPQIRVIVTSIPVPPSVIPGASGAAMRPWRVW